MGAHGGRGEGCGLSDLLVLSLPVALAASINTSQLPQLFKLLNHLNT